MAGPTVPEFLRSYLVSPPRASFAREPTHLLAPVRSSVATFQFSSHSDALLAWARIPDNLASLFVACPAPGVSTIIVPCYDATTYREITDALLD